MAEREVFEEYRQAVEAQARALLDVVQSVALGDLGVQVPKPPSGEGSEILAELARGLQALVDDLRTMAAEQQHAQEESEEAQRKAEEAMEELTALQKRYLREHWERYPETAEERRGYYRFGQERGGTADRWLPAMSEAVQRGDVVIEGGSEPSLAVPLNLYGEVIGVLGLSRDETSPWSEEEVETITEIANEVAEALERQRLLDETQQALIETEELYQASADLAEAQTYEDVLSVLRGRTLLSRADRSVTLNLFGRSTSGDESTRSAVPVAQWSPEDIDGTIPPLLPDPASTLDLLHPDEPTIITDTESSALVDDKVQGIHSTVAVPLTVGGRWIGYVEAYFSGQREFSTAQVRRLMALSGQAAIVIQNLRQLEETWSRARRERVLREITDRMRSVSDPEAVTRAAVRELGSALGRPVFIRLGSAAELSRVQGTRVADNGDGEAPEEADPSSGHSDESQGVSNGGGR